MAERLYEKRLSLHNPGLARGHTMAPPWRCYTRRPISFNSAHVIAPVKRLCRPARMAWVSLENAWRSCSMRPESESALSAPSVDPGPLPQGVRASRACSVEAQIQTFVIVKEAVYKEIIGTPHYNCALPYLDYLLTSAHGRSWKRRRVRPALPALSQQPAGHTQSGRG